MNEVDFFGFCFYGFIFAGMWFLKHKCSIGWIYRLVGEVGWFGLGVYLGLPSIWVCSLVFAWLDYQGFFHWEQEDKSESNAWTDEEVAQGDEVRDFLRRCDEDFPFSYDKPMWETNPPEGLNGPAWTFTVTEENTDGENQTEQRQSQGENLAAEFSRSRKKKVRSTRGRRSKSANGIGRRRPHVKPRSTKKTGRNVRSKKNDRRANAKSTRASKA